MINIDSRLLSALDANEMYLLLNLTNRINGDRFCFPGNKTLCGELKWSREKLQQVKKRLTEKGVIEIERRFKDNSPGQTSNIYRIITPQVGNYTPGGKNGMGEVGKLAGGVPEIIPGGGGNIGTPGVGKPGNEVLTNEVLTTEELNTEELKRENHYLFYCVHSIFENLIDCIFPQLEDYSHCMAGYCEIAELEEITDPTISKSLEKILAAARKIYSAFESLQRPLPEWRETAGFPGTSPGEINPLLEAKDQIKAYTDFCRLTKTFITTDPEKLPERLIQVDWCRKLFDHLKPEIEKERYDPAYEEHDLHSEWLIEQYYYQSIDVWVCKRYGNRIVYGGEEYLKVK
jgi:hypothetical protein